MVAITSFAWGYWGKQRHVSMRDLKSTLSPSSGCRWRQRGALKFWYPTTTLHGITTQKNFIWTLYLNQYSLSPGRVSNQGPAEYKAVVFMEEVTTDLVAMSLPEIKHDWYTSCVRGHSQALANTNAAHGNPDGKS